MANITKNNFIIVYVHGNSDSLEVAQYYAASKGMDTTNTNSSNNEGHESGVYWKVDGQLVGIQCPSVEILSGNEEFDKYIIKPIKASIQNSDELSNKNIWGIVLSYKMPSGFYAILPQPYILDIDDVGNVVTPFEIEELEEVTTDFIISATSRLSRLYYDIDTKIPNKLYNRSIFQRYNSDDANYALICSTLDSPSVYLSKYIIDNGEEVYRNKYINGTFYLDPYSDRHGSEANSYTNTLINFKNSVLNKLNLNQWVSKFTDPYIDPTIPYARNDSFIWSWFNDKVDDSFFQDTNAQRVFCYNADFKGSYTLRDENRKSWLTRSLINKYACAAGSMSYPTIQSFLNPSPFFYTLYRGGTIGEAFLFSCPNLDWTMVLVGDPLIQVSFPNTTEELDNYIEENEAWLRSSKELAKIAAHLYQKEQTVYNLLETVLNSGGVSLETNLLKKAYDLNNLHKENTRKSELRKSVDNLFQYPVKRFKYYGLENRVYNIDDYLNYKNYKVSRLLSDISKVDINENSLLNEGWWEYEFEVEEKYWGFTYYHFILEVAEDANFNNILFTKDSYNAGNWYYEEEENVFQSITSIGVSSRYIGRRVRYISEDPDLFGRSEYLNRGQIYYFRVKQYDLNNNFTPSFSSKVSQIIYT